MVTDKNYPIFKNISLVVSPKDIEDIEKSIKYLKEFHFKNLFEDVEGKIWGIIKEHTRNKFKIEKKILISQNKGLVVNINVKRYGSYPIIRHLEERSKTKKLVQRYIHYNIINLNLFGSRENINLMLNKLKKMKKIKEVIENSSEELRIKKRIEEIMNLNTPRYKKMQDKNFIKILSKFEDEATRLLLKKLKKKLIDGPEQLGVLKEGLNKKEKQLLTDLVKTKIWNVTYTWTCKDCGFTGNSFFDSAMEVEVLIKKSKFTCFCGEKKREVAKFYQLSSEGDLALGFWLEYITYNHIKEETDNVWFSAYFGSMENDIIFILNNSLILISCKDTSIGNSELYSLKGVCDEIGVDKIIVVCSEKHNKKFIPDKPLKENIELIKFKSREDLSNKIKKWLINFKLRNLSEYLQ